MRAGVAAMMTDRLKNAEAFADSSWAKMDANSDNQVTKDEFIGTFQALIHSEFGAEATA
jgi:hypothetical protein